MVDHDWREMDRATRSAAYNNGAAVANSAEQLARWKALSSAVRAEHPADLGVRYGPQPRNLLDIFSTDQPDAPMFVFIHGGYWARNSKDDFACMAHGPVLRGLAVANIGYSLAPTATLTTIAAEIRAALKFLRARDAAQGFRRKLIVSGWSAGGHLAALASGWPDVDATMPISGIFDLEPLVGTLQDEPLRLTPDEVEALSPVRHVMAPSGPIVIAYGANELPELRRQSRDYHAGCMTRGRNATLLPIVGTDHFSVLDALLDPQGELTGAAVALAG